MGVRGSVGAGRCRPRAGRGGEGLGLHRCRWRGRQWRRASGGPVRQRVVTEFLGRTVLAPASALAGGSGRGSEENSSQGAVIPVVPFGIFPATPVILSKRDEPPAFILASRRSLRSRACSAARWAAASSLCSVMSQSCRLKY